jgi:hypothetical protein
MSPMLFVPVDEKLLAGRRAVRPVLAVAVALAVMFFTGVASAQEPEPAPLVDAQRATAFLMQTYEDSGNQVLSCVGSGTLVSADGLILTNAHLAEPFGPCRGERIIVALPVRLDEPPVPTYIAEPLVVSQQYDLAVLQITGSLDGSLIDQNSLNLPFVNLGDASALTPGSALTFVGYPDIGATSVAEVRGVETGITSERSGGDLAWLRTDSELGGGMSGGGAYNANGGLVGVPTSAPATRAVEAGPMCLTIQDSNRDGLITDRDACVPIGGEVTAIRPIVYARPLVETARNRFRLDDASEPATAAPEDDPLISRLFFSTGVGESGLPTEIVTAVPSGATSLYLFFDYRNMAPGTPYEVSVARDGAALPQFSLGPVAWTGDQAGMWYVGTEGKTWPDGGYEFTVLLNGDPVASQTIQVGVSPDGPTLTDLRFGDQTAGGDFSSNGALFPAGITQVDAQFDFSGMADGTAWTEVWYLDGSEVLRETRQWDQGAEGQATVSASNVEGLPAGDYRLEVFVGEQLKITGDITLVGTANPDGQPVVFTNSTIASDVLRDGEPGGQIGASGMNLPLGTNSIYAFVDWTVLPAGTDWTYRWFLDGRLVAVSAQPWNSAASGTDFWLGLARNDPLPEGQYAVEVLVDNHPMFSATATIGSGTQPVSGAQAESDEVFISGQVVDALTGEGIPGALVAVLDVAFESPQFTWNEADIHTQAITDRTGAFDLPRGLPRGNFYTMFVFADGYITIVEDNLTILSDQPSPVDMTIEMSRP